jgi:hypothetical protein
LEASGPIFQTKDFLRNSRHIKFFFQFYTGLKRLGPIGRGDPTLFILRLGPTKTKKQKNKKTKKRKNKRKRKKRKRKKKKMTDWSLVCVLLPRLFPLVSWRRPKAPSRTQTESR